MAVDWSKEPPPSVRADWSKEPPPPAQVPPEQTAAQARDTTSAQALTALDLSQKTGLSPSWVQDNYEAVKNEHELSEFRSELGARPITKQWADQSPQHAAAVRDDMGPLGHIEGWLTGMGDALKQGVLDIGEAEAMREQMGSGGPLASSAFEAEEEQQFYDAREHTIGEDIVRAVPQVALYGAATTLGGTVGLGAMLYAQNKGVLARRIQQAQPLPPETGAIPLKPGETAEDTSLTPEEIDRTATAWSVAEAVTLAGLLKVFVRAVPGAKEALENVGGSILARGAATSVGQAAVRALGAYGIHVLAGAGSMGLQGAMNEAAVQSATTGKVDLQKTIATGVRDFTHMLPIAMAFGAWGPGRDFLAERGRIHEALAHGATLDDLARTAQEVKLRKASPPLAEELFGLMGKGAKVFIDWRAAQKLDLPDTDVARAQATEGSVAVPVETYLAKFADQHDQVREDVKLNPEGYTPREAAERVKELGSMMSVEDAKALYGRMPGEGGFSYPLAGDLTREQLAKGYSLKPEEIDQALGPQQATNPGRVTPSSPTEESKPLHEAMAEQYGGTPEEWAKHLTPQLLEMLSPKEVQPDIKAQVEATVRKLKLGEINPAQFARDAQRASDQATKAQFKVAKAQERATAAAKKSAAAGVEGISLAQQGIEQYQHIRDAEWAKGLRSAIDAGNLSEVNATINDLLKRAQYAPNEAQGREQAAILRSIKRTVNAGQEWLDGLRTGTPPNPNTAEGGLYDVGLAASSTSGLRPGSPEFIAARDEDIATFERDMRRASQGAAEAQARAKELGEQVTKHEQDVVALKMAAEHALGARDLARAYSDAAKTLREKYDAALKKLQTRGADGSNYRDTFHAADAASGNVGYDNVFRGLIDAVSGVALPRPEALDSLRGVLDRMRSRNSPVAFDEGTIQQLLARGKAWEEMTPAEADHVLAAAKNLRTAALREVEVGKQKLDDAAANVTWEAAALPKVKEALVPGNTPWWTRVTRFAGAFHARAIERLDILKSLGDTVKRLVVDDYYARLEKREQLYWAVGAKYEQALRELPPEMHARRFESVAMPRELAEAYRNRGLEPNPDRKFLWTTALMWGDADARQRHTTGLGVEHDLINNWLVDNMTPQEWKFVEGVGNIEQGMLQKELFDKEERKSGVRPEPTQRAPIYDREGNKIADGWYFPLARDRRAYLSDGGAQLADGPKSPNDLFGPSYQRPAVSHRFVKERAQQSSYVVDLNWDRIPQHIDQVIHDIAFDEGVTNWAKLLLHPEVDKAMKERLGMEKRDQVHAWLYVAANERAEAAKGLGALRSAFAFLRNRTQSSALGNSLPVIAAMATHSLVSLVHGEVRPEGAVDYVRALSPDVRNWAMETFEAVRQRESSGRRQLRDDMGLLSDRLRDSYVGKGLELASRVAAFGQNFMDHTMAVGLATAKYNEVMEATHNHAEAVAAANDMVRKNLQPRNAAEKSMLMNDKGAVSAVLIFHGFFNKVYNKAAEFVGPAANAWATLPQKPGEGLSPKEIENLPAGKVSEALRAEGWRQRQMEEYSKLRNEAAWKTAEASGKFLALMGVLGLGKWALGHGKEEGESYLQWVARTVGGAAFDLIPFASNITQPLIDKAVSGKARPVDFRAAPAFAGVQKMIQSVQAAANENSSDRMWKAADAVVMAAGAGSSQYTRTLKYVTGPAAPRDLDRGRVGEFIHGSVYGQQNQSVTLPRLIDKLIEGARR